MIPALRALACLALIAPLFAQAGSLKLLSGNFEQGSLIVAQTLPGAEVSVDGQLVRVDDEGRFLFGLDRDAAESVEVRIAAPGVQQSVQRYPVAKRSYSIQRLSFPLSNAKADPEVEARLESERAANAAARSRDSDLPYAFSHFIWPAKGRITGNFGAQRIINGEKRQPHYGIDIAGKTGTTVVAPADGVVSLSASMLLSGGTLYLDHGQGVSSAFLHLSKILVQEGEVVKQGQKIAEIGRTGRVTGPHLHWQVNWLQARVDAMQLVPNLQTGAGSR